MLRSVSKPIDKKSCQASKIVIELQESIQNYLVDLLREDDRLIGKFGEIKEVALPKILKGILEDIGSDRPELLSNESQLSEELYGAFSETIDTLVRTDLAMPPAHVKTHLASVRAIELRRRISIAYPSYSSTDYYLAVMGLSRESDPIHVMLKINFLAKMDSPPRRAYESVVRHKIDQITARKIRAQIIQDIPSLKAVKSNSKAAAPEVSRAIAKQGEFCFSTLFQWIKQNRPSYPNHPAFTNDVKSCVIRLACKTQQRKAVLTELEIARVILCYDALLYAAQNMFATPLTSVQKVISQYINRPELNTLGSELAKLRSDFKPANFGKDATGRTVRNIAGKFADLATVDATIALCTISKDRPATFQDTKEVSMAFSYLNINPKEFQTVDDLDTAIDLFRSGNLKPHTGAYIYPFAESKVYSAWTASSEAITRKARKALAHAGFSMLLHCATS